MEDEPSLEYDTGGRWQCDDCELVFEVYGMQDVDDVNVVQFVEVITSG